MGGATYRVCGSRPTNSLGKFTFVYLNSYDKEKKPQQYDNLLSLIANSLSQGGIQKEWKPILELILIGGAFIAIN